MISLFHLNAITSVFTVIHCVINLFCLDDNEWENELQAELKEYEMVGQEGEILDDELENEILQEIENETNNM